MQFKSTEARAVPDGGALELAQPARAADFTADVLVPLAQASITGGLLAGLVVFVMTEAVPDLAGSWLKAWGGLSLAISAAVWLWLLRQHRELLWQIERVTGADLDGDRQVGPPTVVRVEVTEGKRQVYLDLPGQSAALAVMARGVLGGRSLSEDTWSGSGGPFSRSDFRAVRDALIERGLAVWRNESAKAQGCELTAAGRAVFRKLAELSD